jgi:16S rRNA (guanine(966)-N(2))-methyltransferase RsmD
MRIRSKTASSSDEIRPLTARALTSIIDTLRPHLFGATVLDLFSGAGRFGEACLKEGAGHVTFVEFSRKNSESLKKNLTRFAQTSRIVTDDVFRFLPAAQEQEKHFEIIFADPPFPIWTEAFADRLLEQIGPVLDDNAIFLVKHPKRMVAFRPIRGLLPWKITQFGESGLTYFKYEIKGQTKIKAD